MWNISTLGHRWRRTGRITVGLLLAVALLACSTPERIDRRNLNQTASDPNEPVQKLDEHTGDTLFVVRRALILARARTDVAANVRDYITLVALIEDKAGRYSSWLVAYRWSTVDPRISEENSLTDGQLELVADGRVITFRPSAQPPASVEQGDLLLAPPARAQSFAYSVDTSTLRYLASARELTARFPTDPWAQLYTIWDDGRPALQGLLDASLGGVPGPQVGAAVAK